MIAGIDCHTPNSLRAMITFFFAQNALRNVPTGSSNASNLGFERNFADHIDANDNRLAMTNISSQKLDNFRII